MAFKRLTRFDLRSLQQEANILMDAARAQLNIAKGLIARRKKTYKIEERCSSGVEVFSEEDKEDWFEAFCEEICPDTVTQKSVFQTLMNVKVPQSGIKLEGCVPLDYTHDGVPYIGNVTFALKRVLDEDGEQCIAVHFAIHRFGWREKRALKANQKWKLDRKTKGGLIQRSRYLSVEELLSKIQSKVEFVDEKEEDMDLGRSNEDRKDQSGGNEEEWSLLDQIPARPSYEPDEAPPAQRPAAPYQPTPAQRPWTQYQPAPAQNPSSPHRPASASKPAAPYQPTPPQKPSASYQPAAPYKPAPAPKAAAPYQPATSYQTSAPYQPTPAQNPTAPYQPAPPQNLASSHQSAAPSEPAQAQKPLAPYKPTPKPAAPYQPAPAPKPSAPYQPTPPQKPSASYQSAAPSEPAPAQKPLAPYQPTSVQEQVAQYQAAPKFEELGGEIDYTQWTVERVLNWIYEFQMDLVIEYKALGDNFREQTIDGEALKDMQKTDLISLGIMNFNDRNKIWGHIRDLKAQKFV